MYRQLAQGILTTYSTSLKASLITSPGSILLGPPDVEEGELTRDPYGAPFADGTFVGKLESDTPGEEGLYNVILVRSPRTPFSFVLSTKDAHPSSEPARAPFYIHAHRLLLAFLALVAPDGGLDGAAVFDKGVDAGDGEDGRKRFTFYFFPRGQHTALALPSHSYALDVNPDAAGNDAPALRSALGRALPLAGEAYNAVLTAGGLLLVPREAGKRGVLEGKRVDGGALFGF